MSDRIGIATSKDLDSFLAGNPDVQAFQIFITDASGVARGKSVRREELARIYDSGRQVAGSILGLDITGQDVDETGLVWDTGDADMTARPVAGTLVRAPWLEAPTGQLMLTMFDGKGAPAAADPRHALVRVLDRFASGGMVPVVACELEFYLLKEEAGGRLVPAGAGRAAERRKIDAYSLQRLDDIAPVFDEIYRATAAQGLPARYADVRVLARPVRDHAASPQRRAAGGRRGGDVQARDPRGGPETRTHRLLHGQAVHRARRQRPARARERERQRRHEPVRQRRPRRHTRLCVTRSAACRRRWRNRWPCSRRTPIPTGAS